MRITDELKPCKQLERNAPVNAIFARLSTLATLAVAALPAVALATAAHASPVKVKVSDLDLMSAPGVTAYQQRAADAGRKFCIDQRNVAAYAACRAGVQVELDEKLAELRAQPAQFAAR